MMSNSGKNSDCFQDHLNSSNKGFEQEKLKVKGIILQ